ncbi:MAG TPA: hypothetical protein VED17_02715 [Nitrososphaerales archaeon]|nr:hypothetical protein [Nitrososphaerales archaeon]
MSFPIVRKKAQFTPESVPPGSVCISSFVVVKDGKGGTLAGRMEKLDVWLERFYMSPVMGPTYVASGKLVLPASHILWYESPLDASQRILNEMALIEVPKEQIGLVDVQSHLRPSTNDPSVPHWDLCLVYKVDNYQGKIKQPEWFKDFGFKTNLKTEDFTRGHGDVLEEAGLL